MIDIFIKSYKPDFWLLQLALRTIKRNVSGYGNLILLIPERDKNDFDTRDMPERTTIHYVSDEGVGYLRQQHYKMTAYKYSKAEFILCADSDIFWDHPVDVQDLVKDGKPEILCTNYNQLKDAQVWREPTRQFIGEPPSYEFMRRLPLTYHRDTLVNISKFCPNLENLIMTSERFSEFNAIGAYAYKFERDKYTFINTDDWTYVPPHAVQVWSHASEEPGADELHLREMIRVYKTLFKSFE